MFRLHPRLLARTVCHTHPCAVRWLAAGRCRTRCSASPAAPTPPPRRTTCPHPHPHPYPYQEHGSRACPAPAPAAIVSAARIHHAPPPRVVAGTAAPRRRARVGHRARTLAACSRPRRSWARRCLFEANCCTAMDNMLTSVSCCWLPTLWRLSVTQCCCRDKPGTMAIWVHQCDLTSRLRRASNSCSVLLACSACSRPG